MNISQLALFATLLLGSCCHKDQCIETWELEKNVKLNGYTLEETDTVYIVHMYNPSDTFITFGLYDGEDTTQLYLGQELTSIIDADVIIPAANRQYRVTDASYITKRSKCGRCFWQNKKDRVLTGCKVDGEAQGTEVTLTK